MCQMCIRDRLCTLGGAPLDNAIESVLAEPDPEKRLLRVASLIRVSLEEPLRNSSAPALVMPRPTMPMTMEAVMADVYKRQLLHSIGSQQDLIPTVAVQEPSAVALQWTSSDPVSYTHLDVYKRQLQR